MSSISYYFTLIVVFVVICVIYYFLYCRYINKRLVNKCQKRYMPHPTTTVFYLCLLLSIILNVLFYVKISKVNKENLSLQAENNGYNKSISITEINSNSPYSYYRDIITSNNSYGYKVISSEKNGFSFYFAQCDFDNSDGCVYYPEYICYIRYDGNLKDDDIEVTTEYIYNENSAIKTSGSLKKEIMFLSRELEKLPQKIKITISERGNKLEEGNIISHETFDIYSVEK